MFRGIDVLSIHSGFIVVVVVFPPDFRFPVAFEAGYGGVGDSVEHGCLDCRIVNHILEYDSVSYLQFVVEMPVSYIVAAQTGVSSHTIGVCAESGFYRASYRRFIGHFETVGHVTGKRDVENGCFDTVVLDYIDYGGY